MNVQCWTGCSSTAACVCTRDARNHCCGEVGVLQRDKARLWSISHDVQWRRYHGYVALSGTPVCTALIMCPLAGLYHAGVIKALEEASLFPRIISGSSVGSIIAAIVGTVERSAHVSVACAGSVGTRTSREVRETFLEGGIDLNFFPPSKGAWLRKIHRLFTQGMLVRATVHNHRMCFTGIRAGVLLDIKILEKAVRANVPDYTFQVTRSLQQ